MKLALKLIGVLAVLALYLLFWPVPIQPVVWQAQAIPPEDAYPENSLLRGVERLADGVGTGPEGIAIDAQGRIYAGYDDGRVMRFDGMGGKGELLAQTGGRPLGVSVGDKGIFVADAVKGLLQIEDGGRIRVLSTAADGQAFRFVDDVDQSAADPHVYFTDASARFGIHQLMADVLEHGDSGRVLRYDPATGETTTLMRGLHFANGIALSPDAGFLLVSETNEYRVWRYWLKGEKAGQKEIFIDNLPGFPDNLSISGSTTGGANRVWLALYAPRDKVLDDMAGKPGLRKVAYRLPDFLRPQPVLRSWVLSLDFDGKILRDLQYRGQPEQHEAKPPYGPITSVELFGSELYFGSLSDTAIGHLALSSHPPAPAQ